MSIKKSLGAAVAAGAAFFTILKVFRRGIPNPRTPGVPPGQLGKAGGGARGWGGWGCLAKKKNFKCFSPAPAATIAERLIQMH